MKFMKKINQLFFLCFILNTILLSSCDSNEGTGPVLIVSDQSLSVQESIESGQLVGQIQGESTNDQVLNFRLVSGNESGIFELSESGELTLAEEVSLDYEEKTSYDLEVEVSDGINLEIITVTVNVTDVDESGLLLLNGVNYEFGDEGILFDEGPSDPFDANVETHYIYSFQFAEGNLSMIGEGDYEFTEINMWFVTEFYVPGTEGFSTGTFSWAAGEATAEDLEGQSFFKELAFVIDGNDNGMILNDQDDLDNDVIYMATGGNVVLASSGKNIYQMDFDLTISQVLFDPEKNFLYEGEIVPDTERRIRFNHEVNCVIVADDTPDVVDEEN
jgi:hypothetical protein